MKRIGLILIVILLMAFPVLSQNVNIPDANFLAALIELGVDTNEDGLISNAEAEAVTDLSVGWRSISDLTGIDAFNNLENLSCSGNQIDSLDVSNNAALTSLFCNGNQIDSLDVSNNMALTELSCYANQITSLDVSNNAALTTLYCFNNQLTSLDVSNCTALEALDCFENQLTSLDVSSCIDLQELYCSDNQFTSLDVSNNTALLELWVGGNKLSSLDLSFNTALIELNLSNMPSLYQVCVWEMPFPPVSVNLDTTGSPNVYFSTECSDNIEPNILAVDSLYLPEYIEATSSEDGMIYLVPENTEKDIAIIRDVSIDSVEVVANSPVNISTSSLANGIYWLYARDSTGNISEPKAFTILGVGVDKVLADKIRIYPNPTHDLITIQAKELGQNSISISSLNGQFIFNTSMEGTSHQIDLSSFQKGVYFITIRSEDFVTTRKIIKLK